MDLADLADHAEAAAAKLAGVNHRNHFAGHFAHGAVELCFTGIWRGDTAHQIKAINAEEKFIKAILANVLLGSGAIQ
ncbi:hypothetical protein D3C78_1794920 [compost metagenome]